MKTHKTINEAFNNGKGDCFFTKNNEFVCVSRKNSELHTKLINEGYTLLSYTEVLKAAGTTTEAVLKKAVDKIAEVKSTIPTKKYNNNSNSLSFLEDRSDADSGL